MTTKQLRSGGTVHFVGAGGSGTSAALMLARHAGFRVTACDAKAGSPYALRLEKAGVAVETGHCVSHIRDADIVAASPALLGERCNVPEILDAGSTGKLTTWQHFVADHLMMASQVVAVAGTHGKSTTTALLGVLLEAAGKNPTVLLGALVKQWDANFRLGNLDLLVCEADESCSAFARYRPSILIINNVEMDHPELFASEEAYIQCFSDIAERTRPGGAIVFNGDDSGASAVIQHVGRTLKKRGVFIVGFSTPGGAERTHANYADSWWTTSVQYAGIDHQRFKLCCAGMEHSVHLNVPGTHNAMNATAACAVATILGADIPTLIAMLEDFQGVGRRFELRYRVGDVRVYDDYAQHPTEMSAGMAVARKMLPKHPIVAVVEVTNTMAPTQFCQDLLGALDGAETIVLTGPAERLALLETARPDELQPLRAKDPTIRVLAPWAVTRFVVDRAWPSSTVLVFGATHQTTLVDGIISSLREKEQ